MHVLKKEKAIALRREGRTYSEILKQVSVAKSTLTEWFREVKLTTPQFQRLTEKKLAASKRGGLAKHNQRLERMQVIRTKALKDITHISKRELWLIGIALYWAEGNKEKEYRPGGGIKFGNSDPRMIKLFIKWLTDICCIPKDQIGIEILIHENSVNRVDKVKEYWAKATSFPVQELNKIYFKKTHIKTNRKNIGDLYYGGLRVTVKASSGLLRQVTGWTEAIVQSY